MDPNTISKTANILPLGGVTLTEINALFTIFIGLFVAWVAFQQYRLGRAKFKLDLFDKRYAIYKATQRFLSHILKEARMDLKKLWEFRGDTQNAVFLFDNDIPKYLDEIDKKALKLWETKEEYKEMPKGDERSKLCRDESQLCHELIKKLPELKVVFGKYLKFRKWK